jgi:hypothetical protein
LGFAIDVICEPDLFFHYSTPKKNGSDDKSWRRLDDRGGAEAAWSTLVGLREHLGGSCSKLWPSLYISAIAIVEEMVQIMCQRFIQERYDSGLGPERSWKYSGEMTPSMDAGDGPVCLTSRKKF